MIAPEEKPNRRILVVDDNQAIHDDFRKVLAPEPRANALDDTVAVMLGAPAARRRSDQVAYEIDAAHQGEEGLAMVQAALREDRPYAMAFVDMRIPPGWDGLRTIEEIWAIDPAIQIVICTAFSDHSWSDIIDRVGETDGLFILKKPFDVAEARQVACAMTRKWSLARLACLKMDELERLVAVRTREIGDANRRIASEIGHRERVQDRLLHAALHDELTGLPNRALLLERLGRCIERSQRQTDYRYALLFIDLDDFKVVNDSLGHRAGDDLLVGIAQRLSACVRSLDATSRPHDDTTARLGGDEFVILLDGIRAADDALTVAERMRQSLSEVFKIGPHEVGITVSIGITTSDLGYEDPDEVMRDADTALYEAKSHGKSRFVVFGPAMRERAVTRLQIETDLRSALERDELSLRYHPIVCLRTGRIEGFEALVRWRHPQLGMVGPSDFIPIAEQSGQIVTIGRWTVREACHQLQAWRTRYPQFAQLTISLNLAPPQLAHPALPDDVRAILDETGLDARQLKLEINEHIVLHLGKDAGQMLDRLRELGIDIYLDDFGTGYSSLSHLRTLPIDALKIDRAFVRDMQESREASSTVQAIIQLAQNHRIIVIAEGIETNEQLVQLQTLDCDLGQGYYFSKPLEPAAAEALLATEITWARSA
jgi:diguanylate cyclase (GGDEF)-like protein